MMRRFLRGFARLLVSLALGAGAGVLGWCWIGWINGTTNSPRELYQKPAESASNGASNSNAWKTLLNQSRRGNAEARVREIYALSKSLSASGRKELRNELRKSPNRYLEALLSEDEGSPDHFAGSVYLATVLRTWMAGDHASCLTAIEQLPPHLRSQIPTRLLKAATMLNGQAALKLLGPSLMQMIPPAGLDVTLQAWADQDAAGALTFAQQMTTPEARQKAMAGVLRSMAISDPNRCLQMLASLPPESSKQLRNWHCECPTKTC